MDILHCFKFRIIRLYYVQKEEEDQIIY